MNEKLKRVKEEKKKNVLGRGCDVELGDFTFLTVPSGKQSPIKQ